MRFILAAIAFLASAALLVVGWLQVSEAKSADTVVASGQATAQAPLLVIPSDTLIEHAGTQAISITGEGPIRVAIGRQDDIAGWVGTTQHEIVTHDDATGQLLFTPGEADATQTTSPDILGSDLWFEEFEGDGTLELQQTLPAGFALLVAADGEAPAPSQVSITWPLDGRAPMAGPLFLGGGALLIISLGLLLWALLSLRRRSKPQRQSQAELDAAAVTPVVVDAASEPAPVTPAFSFGRSTPSVEETLTDAEIDPVEVSQNVVTASLAVIGRDAQAVAQAEPAHPAPSAPSSARSAEAEASAFAPPSAAGAQVDDPFSWTAQPPAAESTNPAAREAEPAAVAPGIGSETEGEPGAERDDDSDDSDDADGPSGDEPPAASTPASAEPAQEWRRPRGRDRTNAPKRLFRFIPVLLIGSIALTGCSADLWPAEWGGSTSAPVTPTPTSEIDQALLSEDAPQPAVNAEQLRAVLDDATAIAQQADAENRTELLEPRFTGAALQEREADYKAKAANNALEGTPAFPAGEVVYSIPQAAETWPKAVFAVVETGGETPSAPYAVTLTQETARDNFKVSSLVQLSPDVTLPEAAPAEIGAPGLDSLTAPLVLAPDELAAAYADIINAGDASAFAAQFAAEGDQLRTQVSEARAAVTGEIDPNAAKLEFTTRASENAPIGVQALEGGALVTVSIEEVEKLSARTQLATLSVQGRTAALAGASSSSLGFETIYTDQLLFFVPAQSTGQPIQLLGYTNTMTGARQLNANEVTYG